MELSVQAGSKCFVVGTVSLLGLHRSGPYTRGKSELSLLPCVRLPLTMTAGNI